jgi:serine/threonine-protein kinase
VTNLRAQLQSSFGEAYTIERELGGGGMSRVFLATEQSLGRPVVVKVLPSESAGAISVERFRREIRLAASLQQANIVPVLSAGDAGGVTYYTMPFVKGESLRSYLVAKGTLPVGDCVAILRDVARALAYAHAEGVVHRDIKPENILLSGGTAVVTDFGIAKAVAESTTRPDAATLTQIGMALGTPAYMAPEQAIGEQVDHRADIYALGVVAYEMLTGATPFAGRSAQAMVAAHVTETPDALGEKCPGAPAALVALVMQCLAKEPEARPPSAAAVLLALDTATTPDRIVTAAAVKEEKPSIAVLPFENLSPDQADEYFADGLTDEIITDLSAIHSLRVIARASMMRFKASGKDPRAVARELNVRYALDGSVRRAGSSLRLTVRLTDTADDCILWSDKLGGSPQDVFAMQEQVSGKIVAALRVVLTPREKRHLRDRPIVDLQAYEAYLQARQLMWTFTVPALEHARSLIEAAAARIGENARLTATMGGIHINFVETGQVDSAAHLVAAQACTDRLATLDPDSFALFSLRGWLEWRRGEIREAIASLRRARELDPNNPEVGIILAYAFILAGQDANAREIADAYATLDPMTPLFQCMPGFCEIVAGHPQNAVPYYRRFYQLDQANPIAHLFLVWSLCQAGVWDEAKAVARGLAERFPDTPFGALGTAYAAALGKDMAGGRKAITPSMISLSRHSESIGTMLANVLTLLRDRDAAIGVLENSVRLGLAHYPYLAQRATVYAALRSHARFQRLLVVVRARWERGGASAKDHAHDPFLNADSQGAGPDVGIESSAPLANDQ